MTVLMGLLSAVTPMGLATLLSTVEGFQDVRIIVKIVRLKTYLGAKCLGPGKCLWCQKGQAILLDFGVYGTQCVSSCPTGYFLRESGYNYECIRCWSPRCKEIKLTSLLSFFR